MLMGETWFLACEELQTSKSISMQSGFIGYPFPWKRMHLAKVGGGRRGRA